MAAGFNYRGVHALHPALAAARLGVVEPGNVDGKVTPVEHNLGNASADSPYTSWTNILDLAIRMANLYGSGGLVLRLPNGAARPGDGWFWAGSPDIYWENEVLLHGIRDDAEVIWP